MAFSFGTPAASAPAFGAASSSSLFGAASASSLFGAASAPGLFGAASSSSLFGAASTPSLFGAASSSSLFGAAPTPSLFGANGVAASSASLFGAASTPSLFGAALAPATAQGGGTLFGGFGGTGVAAGQQAAGQQAAPPPKPLDLSAVRELESLRDGFSRNPSNPQAFRLQALLLSAIEDPSQRVRPAGVDESSWRAALNAAGIGADGEGEEGLAGAVGDGASGSGAGAAKAPDDSARGGGPAAIRGTAAGDGLGSPSPGSHPRLWPVLATGFGDLLARRAAQEAALAELRERLASLRATVEDAGTRQAGGVRSRMRGLRERQREMRVRLLKVLRHVDALEGRLVAALADRAGQPGIEARTRAEGVAGELRGRLASAEAALRPDDPTSLVCGVAAAAAQARLGVGRPAGGLADASARELARLAGDKRVRVALADHSRAVAALQEVLRRDERDLFVLEARGERVG